MSKHMRTEESGSDIDASDEYSRDNVERYSNKRRKHSLRRSVLRGVIIAFVVALRLPCGLTTSKPE